MSAKSGDKKCGIVMPISAIDGCSESHWSDVRNILTESIQAAGLEASLVSDANDVGIIQKRIIQNLYENPVVVCDVSGKNPNVMFELGIRLAFDKATVIVKDDRTSYSFDTSVIEHIEYPRDLRFSKIVEFKAKLTEKIKATEASAKTDPAYSTFLKHFGEFKVAKLDRKEVSDQEYIQDRILDELKSVRNVVQYLAANSVARNNMYNNEREILREKLRMQQFAKGGVVVVPLNDFSESEQIDLHQRASEHPGIIGFSVGEDSQGPKRLTAYLSEGVDKSEVENHLKAQRPRKTSKKVR